VSSLPSRVRLTILRMGSLRGLAALAATDLPLIGNRCANLSNRRAGVADRP